MKSKLAIFFDTFAIVFILFIILYFWLYKLIKNAFFTLFSAISVSVLLFYFIFKHFIKKYKLSKLSLQDQKLAKKCLEKLRFMESESVNKFYEKLLNVKHNSGNIFVGSKSLFYISTKHKLDDKDFMLANDFYLKNGNEKALSFIAANVSDEFTKLIANSPTNFYVFSETDLFLVMKEQKIYPDNIETSAPRQKRFNEVKSKLASSITKSHFKEFFFSGLSLIFISIVIPFSSYYLIFGSILLILSLISLFIKNKNSSGVLTDKNLSSLIKDATNK